MGASVVASVETAAGIVASISPAIRMRLLGPVTVLKDEVELALPASRKVRALLVFLAVSPCSVTRSRLCELLWDVPNDPRGELRWSLSKLRSVLDDQHRRRVEARGDAIELELSDCVVDVTQITATMSRPTEQLSLEQLRALEQLFVGDFAEGLEIDRSPQFASWLGAQRRRFRAVHMSLLEQLVGQLADASEDSLLFLEKWLQLTPFDCRAHELLLATLWRSGRIQEGEQHLAATIRRFETEGLEWLAIREAWKKIAKERAPDQRSAACTCSTERPAVEVDLSQIAAVSAHRASICVMPFIDRSSDRATHGGLADGLTEDIITQLAKLRSFFVIARGSVFALSERNIPAQEAARLLNVDYVASGWVRRHNDRLTVSVEVAEARAARIVWVEDFTYKVDDALAALDEIGKTIVASIAEEIETAECKRAILKPPNSLNAWEAYHRGLWHVYRFNREDNGRAAHYFELALQQDRTFARAYAGLSFTHFQNAFLHRTAERDKEIDRAYACAGQSLIADDRDPAAHWAMGRALWLRGCQDEALRELEQSISLSPNFALGHYTLGFVHAQSGDPQIAIGATDHSRRLSPFDPLMFAMFAARAVALVRLGRCEEAADWAMKGAARPNAHVHVLAIAANCMVAAGRMDQALELAAVLRKRAPSYRLNDFLGAFHFAAETTAVFRHTSSRIGLQD